jgi:hypothetical protein
LVYFNFIGIFGFFLISELKKCYKRKNEDDPHEDYDNVDSSLISNFKSAKEQLAIENAKQGNNSSGQQMQQQPSLAKRPMGNMPK